MLQVNKTKKIFHDHGVQLSVKALNMIREDLERHIYKMAERCNEGNVKRLTPETYHIAIGNYLEKWMYGDPTNTASGLNFSIYLGQYKLIHKLSLLMNT